MTTNRDISDLLREAEEAIIEAREQLRETSMEKLNSTAYAASMVSHLLEGSVERLWTAGRVLSRFQHEGE